MREGNLQFLFPALLVFVVSKRALIYYRAPEDRNECCMLHLLNGNCIYLILKKKELTFIALFKNISPRLMVQ